MLANDDRRTFPRLAIDCTVVYRRTNKDVVAYGAGKNLSGNGILFEAQQPVSVGDEIEIDVIPTLEKFKPLNAIAHVVRVDVSHSPYLVAAALTRIIS